MTIDQETFARMQVLQLWQEEEGGPGPHVGLQVRGDGALLRVEIVCGDTLFPLAAAQDPDAPEALREIALYALDRIARDLYVGRLLPRAED